jgi:hypothetical protein
MKKLFVQIVILLFIALAGSNTKLYAGSRAMNQNITEAVQAVSSGDIFMQRTASLENYIKSALTQTEKPVEKIDPTDTEDEEDEMNAYKALSFKKLAGISGMLIPAQNIFAPQAYAHTLIQQNSLQQRRHFLYIPSGKRYIYFSVFRI